MPDSEQLGIMAVLGLLMILYVVGLTIKYLVEYWYLFLLVLASVIYLRIWWNRRYPIYLDEDDDLEPVHQE